jgi:hypothetical protein
MYLPPTAVYGVNAADGGVRLHEVPCHIQRRSSCSLRQNCSGTNEHAGFDYELSTTLIGECRSPNVGLLVGLTLVASPPATTFPHTQSSSSPLSTSIPSQTAPQQALGSPSTQTTPAVPTSVPGDPAQRGSKRIVEWTNVAMAMAALIFADYSVYGTAIAVLSARRTVLRKYKEECSNNVDHDLPILRDCSERCYCLYEELGTQIGEARGLQSGSFLLSYVRLVLCSS